MTDEQMKKAQAALKDHHSRQLRKKILLRIYREDQQKAERWALPFRMIHRREFIPGEVPPNDFFPHLSDIGRSADGSPYHIADARRITRQQAKYYFTRVLAHNEPLITSYGASDWTGINISHDEAERQLQGYMERIRDFYEHPEKYDQTPHPLHKERYFICDAL